MPNPSYFAASCLLLAAPAWATNYPPPPGPYASPAVQQWLAARTEPLLASARPDAHAEAPLSGSASGEPEVITRLISERAEPGRGPGSLGGAAPIAGKKTDSGPIAPWSEPPAAGSTSPEWYTGKPLRWRDPAAAAGSGGRHYQAAVPHRGLLDPLPAEPTYIRPPGTPVQKPAFASPTPASGHHRSTQDLLALYLDYAPARLTADPAHPGQAKARSEAPPPAPESRRYFYRPTGTTFEFRALEPDPRAPVRPANRDVWDASLSSRAAANRR